VGNPSRERVCTRASWVAAVLLSHKIVPGFHIGDDRLSRDDRAEF